MSHPLQELLTEWGASDHFIEYVDESRFQGWDDVWSEMTRPDWMLWLLFNRAGHRGWPSLRRALACAYDCVDYATPIHPFAVPTIIHPRLPTISEMEKVVGDVGAENVEEFVSGIITTDT